MKWQYLSFTCLEHVLADELNGHGAKGWECISVFATGPTEQPLRGYWVRVVLKRPAPND